MNNTNVKMVGGVLAGAALGAVITLLSAPDPGKKTRRKLKKEANSLQKSFNKSIHEALKKVKSS